MNELDIVIIIIIGTTLVIGLFRGAIKEIFSLGSVIVGFFIANSFYGDAGRLLMSFLQNSALAMVLGYALLFVGSSIIIRLIGTLLAKGTKKIKLGWADHLLGGTFGFLKGGLIISLIVMILSSFLPNAKVLKESNLTPYVISAVGLMAKVAPSRIHQRFTDGREKLEDTWQKRVDDLHKYEKQAEQQKELLDKLMKED
jgi:membrane protein required for colicin V production